MKILFIALVLSFTSVLSVPAQNNRTIKVTGTSEHNLSPNEIVIQISFEEYFTDEAESMASKIKIETIEKKIRTAIAEANIKKEKITSGGVIVVRPYKRSVYKKRRLNKTLLVCIENTDQYILLTRKFEETGYFDNVITTFSIAEFRSTEKGNFEKESKSLAYKNALENAQLIIAESGDKLGKAISISEVDTRRTSPNNNSFYAVEPSEGGASGFKPVVINYELVVVFEIE